MIIIDIFIVLIALGVLLVGAPLAAKKFRDSDPKRKVLDEARQQDELGQVNVVKFNLEQLRNCTVCHQLTDPGKDLLATGAWVHTDCYLNTVSKKGNA